MTESDVNKGGYVVVSSFKCINNFNKTYYEGDKIVGFTPERIEKLLKLGYIKKTAGRPTKDTVTGSVDLSILNNITLTASTEDKPKKQTKKDK